MTSETAVYVDSKGNRIPPKRKVGRPRKSPSSRVTRKSPVPKAPRKRKVKATVVPKKREICIYGYAEETRDLVHGLSEDVEIWGINMSSVFLKKRTAARWFQLHPRDWTTGGREPTGYWGRPKEHLTFLKKFKGPVYMSYEEPDVPNCIVFDMDVYLKALSINKKRARHYFTSTFAYIMAQAISEKPDKIYLYGINLTALDEYTKQRNCMEYWIGQAEGRGIEVVIPSESALCKAPDYGLGAKNPTEEMEKHFMDRLQLAKDKYMEAAFNVNTAESLKTDTEFWVSIMENAATKVLDEWGKIKESSKTLEEMIAGIDNLGVQLQAAIQEQITGRMNSLKEMSSRQTADLNGRMGQLKELQHAIGFFGTIDVRAPALPAVRFPSPELAKEIVIPKPTAV